MRAQLLVGLCLILGGAACGESKDDAEGDGDGAAVAGAGAGGAGAGGAAAVGAGAGGARAGAGGGGSAAGATPAGGSGGSGPVTMDAGVEMDAGDPMVALPTDGNALSVCASSDDCNGDDLVCAVFGTHQGYCAEDCGGDEDCAPIGGLAPVCDAEGRCVIDCAGGDAGAGECPENMLCVEVMETVLDELQYRCQYPEPKNLDLYQLCNLELDDADCKEGLVCQLFPGLTDLRDSVCVTSCTEASECDALGSAATPVCDPDPLSPLDGICALECEQDADCPDDLTCVEVDLLLGRCGHEL